MTSSLEHVFEELNALIWVDFVTAAARGAKVEARTQEVSLPRPFPSMKWREMLKLLKRELGYTELRCVGSHRTLISEGRPRLTFSFQRELSGVEVGDILVNQVGLSKEEAVEVVKNA